MPQKKKRDKREEAWPHSDITNENLLSMTPGDARYILDDYALRLQKAGDMSGRMNEWMFDRLLLYIHKYLWGLAYNKYIIRGHEGKDLYQEGRIALFTKAIPKYNPKKGMSFFNFAKMCVRRHLITLLNTSRHRKKDIPMNQSVSLETVFGTESQGSDIDGGTLMNIIYDEENDFISDMCMEEDKEHTRDALRENLSRFELSVLNFYLEDHSYRQIAKLVSKEHGKKYNEKSIDNALLRIRHKAASLIDGGVALLPLFRGRRCRKKRKGKK